MVPINNSVFLLQVKVIHDYAATDGDELELKIGDTVLALAFDNPDEQVIHKHFLSLMDEWSNNFRLLMIFSPSTR